MAHLLASSGHRFELPAVGVTFGSDACNDVVIPAVFGVAPCQFAIWPEPGGYRLLDRGSPIGTQVNGYPVPEALLQHGDTICAGNLRLSFHSQEMPAVSDGVSPVGQASSPHMAAPPTLPTFAPLPPSGGHGEPSSLAQLMTGMGLQPAAATAVRPPMPPFAPLAQPPLPPAPGREDFGTARLPAETPGPVLPQPEPRLPIGSPPSVWSPTLPVWNEQPQTSQSPPSLPGPRPTPAQATQALPFQITGSHAETGVAPALPFSPIAGPGRGERPPVPQTQPLPPIRESPFEIFQPENAPEEDAPGAILRPASPPKHLHIPQEATTTQPPPWLRPEQEEQPALPAAEAPQKSPVIIPRLPDARGSRARRTRLGLVAAILVMGGLVAGVLAVNQWRPDLVVRIKDQVLGWFPKKPASEQPGQEVPPVKDMGTPPAAPPAQVAATVEASATPSKDTVTAHRDLAPKFFWPEATTLFSLGFPRAELRYVATAPGRGLPLPGPHCSYLEKHFDLKLQDLERLTAIQGNAEKPGVVIITTRQNLDADALLKSSALHVATTERLANGAFHRYVNRQGAPCGLLVIDRRNLVVGEPQLIQDCLAEKSGYGSAAAAALWPDFASNDLGTFLWTVKVDDTLRQQLSGASATSPAPDLGTVQSFAVRYDGSGEDCECFALRSAQATPEGFAAAATNALQSMLTLLSAQTDTRSAPGSVAQKPAPIQVNGSTASAVLQGGGEFVNLFLEGFFRPNPSERSPLEMLSKARTLAHSFNLARDLGAPEARQAHSVLEALEALQRGMSGSGRGSGMEFQTQTIEPDELQTLNNFLTFSEGYLFCRPNLEAMPEAVRNLIREASERLNAETVLSLCVPPSGEKIVRIKNLPAYVRQSISQLMSTRGAMALFGMPPLTDDELAGALKYIEQDQTGKLAWKPGEPTFTDWKAQSASSALQNASELAGMAGAAKAAGSTRLKMAADVREAITMLMQGVKGSGRFSAITFRFRDLNSQELQAAAAHLQLDDGALKLNPE